MSWIITGTEKYETDPYRSQVSLLLHGDGTNGSTTITDSSPSPKTVTAFGNAQISTAQSKFGGASLSFDGSGDYLSTPYTTALALKRQDFTVETWAYWNQLNADGVGLINAWEGSIGSKFSFIFGTTSGNKPVFAFSPNGTSVSLVQATAVISTGEWIHLAATRSGDTFRLFRNGVEVASLTSSATIFTPPSISLAIGANLDPSVFSSYVLNGYLDEIRITKGVARYTSNFTPPTAPFPDI